MNLRVLEDSIDIQSHSFRSIHCSSASLLSPGLQKICPSSSQSDCQSFQKEELLKLEVKQLKRQNNFLKKKISELKKQLQGDETPKKKKKSKIVQKESKQDKQIVHASVDFFCSEISYLIKSIREVFKIDISNEEEIQNNLKDSQELGHKKYYIFKKFHLNRQLQRIMLEKEEKRYPLLLETFMTFYQSKEECDRYVRTLIDGIIEKTQNLTKLVLDKAKKKRELRESLVRSNTYLCQKQDECLKFSFPLEYHETLGYQNKKHKKTTSKLQF